MAGLLTGKSLVAAGLSCSSDEVPAPRGTQAHRSTGRQRANADLEAQPDGTLVKALARAWRWQRMLDEGVYTSVTEIGAAENISKSYVSRILRLGLLAPDLVEAILAGITDQTLMLERLEGPLPERWEEQRRKFLPIG